MQYPRSCPMCGADNRPIAKLCDQCGAPLADVPPAPPAPADWQTDLNRPRVAAARLLNQAYSTTYRLTEHRLRPVGVSPVQFRALTLVCRAIFKQRLILRAGQIIHSCATQRFR